MNRVTLLCAALWLCSYADLSAQCDLLPDEIYELAFDCDNTTPICIDMPLASYADHTIIYNGSPYSGQIAGCQFDTIYHYTYSTLYDLGNSGPYQLNSWSVDGIEYSFQFEDIADLVAQMNDNDPAGNWTHYPANLRISGGVPGTLYSSMDITAIDNGFPSTIGVNSGTVPAGTQLYFAVGEHELVILNDDTGCTDTTQITIECFGGLTTQTVTNTIAADENPYVFCIDTTELPGNVVSIADVCADDNDGFVNFLINEDNFCIKYQGVKCSGTGTACIVVCDDLGFCDTTLFDITVDNSLCDLDPDFYQIEVLINFDEVVCLDTTELPGEILNIQNVFAGNGNADIDLNDNNFCIEITGDNIGEDEAWVVLTDQYGNTDTSFININVIPPSPENFVDTLFFGEMIDLCVNIDQLAGNTYTFFNDCSDNSEKPVNFVIDENTLCAKAEATRVGEKKACLIVCDEFGVCDTTTWLVVVADNGDPCALASTPIAQDDFASTLQNNAVEIRVLDNDDIPQCSPSTLTIIEQPNDGIAQAMAAQETLMFMPNEDYCGEVTFEYELCNDEGCSQAMVTIEVGCTPPDEIKIFTAFSPNNDGINDQFKIENIENFPQSELLIFNRWGTQVFRRVGYQNNWEGEYRNTDLPDGTYFYILNLDESRTYKGYVQLGR